VTHRTLWASRLAPASALLAGTPAIFAAAWVKNRCVLVGATAAAAVIAIFGAVVQNQHADMAQRRDKDKLCILDGCLVLPDRRLPAVGDITGR
jgi:hypothetical protein